MIRIGVDLMGSDSAPLQLFGACLDVAKTLSSSDSLLLFATDLVAHHLRGPTIPGIDWHLVAEEITMSDSPQYAARRKRDSSLVVGLALLSQNKIDAFVSAGNTGALIAAATMAFPLWPGIERLCLLATLPTAKKPVAVVDVGANVDCPASLLTQFAKMGVAFQRSFHNIASPRIALLNIGSESNRGSKEVKEAFSLLQSLSETCSDFQFIGNIEGRFLFKGQADVIVADGFAGNVAVKTLEGISSFVTEQIEKNPAMREHWQASDFNKRLDYRLYPGALLCGIDPVIIKCHGEGLKESMFHSILYAYSLAKDGVISKMKHFMSLTNLQ